MQLVADAALQQAMQLDGGGSGGGTLEKFDPNTGTMSRDEEHLLLYLMANNIAEDNTDRREAIVHSEVEKNIYQVLSDVCSPETKARDTRATVEGPL